MTETRELYPPIEPFDSGMLDVGDGYRISYTRYGNPQGKPAVFIHGGPGGGSSPMMARIFDPELYCVTLFDQRGCGKSTPHASDPEADLSANTTWHLVADIEKLREHLGYEKWLVSGGSWGSTLSLAYSETHPDRVTELVLRGIFTLRESELDFFYQDGASHVFRDLWEAFLTHIPEGERDNLRRAYHRRLFDPNPEVHVPAAIEWSAWETGTVRHEIDFEEIAKTRADAEWSVAFARIENHYFVNGGWFEDGQLIRDAHNLAGIPTVLVQGRYDMCTPMATAWELSQHMPHAELHIIPDAGHAMLEPGTRSALIAALDRFAK